MVKTLVSEDEIRNAANYALPDRKLLRIDEVARFFDVSERTIRLWAENGLLKYGKMRGTVRIFRSSVEEWLERMNKQKEETQ